MSGRSFRKTGIVGTIMRVMKLHTIGATIAVCLSILSMPSLAWASDPIGVWALRKFKGASVTPSSPETATLIFGRRNLLGGTAACSSFIGERLKWFKQNGKSSGYIRIDRNQNLIWTAIACNDTAAAKIGSDFWGEMDHSKRWTIIGRTLVVTFEDGTSARFEAVGQR